MLIFPIQHIWINDHAVRNAYNNFTATMHFNLKYLGQSVTNIFSTENILSPWLQCLYRRCSSTIQLNVFQPREKLLFSIEIDSSYLISFSTFNFVQSHSIKQNKIKSETLKTSLPHTFFLLKKHVSFVSLRNCK